MSGSRDLSLTLYRKVLAPSSASRDGETSTLLELVDYGGILALVFRNEDGDVLVRAWPARERDRALEEAVHLGAHRDVLELELETGLRIGAQPNPIAWLGGRS